MEVTAAVVVPLVNAVPSAEEVFLAFLQEMSRAPNLIDMQIAAGIAAQTILGIAG